MSGSGSRRNRRRRLVVFGGLGAVALLVVLGLVFWPSYDSGGSGASMLQVDPVPEVEGPVEITGAEALLIWRTNPVVPVKIRLHNRTDKAVDARTWWTLALASEPEPWENNAMQALPRTVRLKPHATVMVEVPIPGGNVLPGYYRLSLWSHAKNATSGKWAHSDGRAILGSVRVFAGSDALEHVSQASDELWLADVAVPSDLRAGTESKTWVSVVNATSTSKVVEVWWYLAPVGTEEPWKSPAAIRSKVTVDTVAAGAVTDLVVPMRALPNPGRYELSVWLHQDRGKKSVSMDGAFYNEPLTVIAGG